MNKIADLQPHNVMHHNTVSLYLGYSDYYLKWLIHNGFVCLTLVMGRPKVSFVSQVKIFEKQ